MYNNWFIIASLNLPQKLGVSPRQLFLIKSIYSLLHSQIYGENNSSK